MAKEIMTWCQIDLDDDERRVPGEEYEVSINGLTYTVDLCPDHHLQHLAPLTTLLGKYGELDKTSHKTPKTSGGGSSSNATKYTPNTDGVYQCAEPGCGREFTTAQGIGRHMTSHRN